MKNIFILYPTGLNSTLATARICTWLNEFFTRRKMQSSILDGASMRDVDIADVKKSIVFVVNLPKLLVKNIEVYEKIIKEAAIVVYVQNDYTIQAPTPDMQAFSICSRAFTYRLTFKKPLFVWSTCQDKCEKHSTMFSYIDWNALMFKPMNVGPRRENTKVLYYGAFRKGRQNVFDRYMVNADHMVVSTTKLAANKFIDRYGVKVIPPISIPNDLCNWGISLYIQDKCSNSKYHSLANRFYECLSAKVAMFVDRDAVTTFKKFGLTVPNFCTVDGTEDLLQKMKAHSNVRKWQQENWSLNPTSDLPHDKHLELRFKTLIAEQLQ